MKEELEKVIGNNHDPYNLGLCMSCEDGELFIITFQVKAYPKVVNLLKALGIKMKLNTDKYNANKWLSEEGKKILKI